MWCCDVVLSDIVRGTRWQGSGFFSESMQETRPGIDLRVVLASLREWQPDRKHLHRTSSKNAATAKALWHELVPQHVTGSTLNQATHTVDTHIKGHRSPSDPVHVLRITGTTRFIQFLLSHEILILPGSLIW